MKQNYRFSIKDSWMNRGKQEKMISRTLKKLLRLEKHISKFKGTTLYATQRMKTEPLQGITLWIFRKLSVKERWLNKLPRRKTVFLQKRLSKKLKDTERMLSRFGGKIIPMIEFYSRSNYKSSTSTEWRRFWQVSSLKLCPLHTIPGSC